MAFLLWRVYSLARHVWRLTANHHKAARPVPLPGGFPGRELVDALEFKRD